MNVAIILAAGESCRMGQTKQLLPFGGKTMLECVISAFESPKIDQILVVLGHKAEEIAARLEPRPPRVKIVVNPHYRDGMFTSVQAALRALPKGAKLVLVALCDQPRLQRATVGRLVNEFEKKRHKILIPVFNGRQGHPLVFSARFVPEILALDEALTLKHFLANHPDEITRLAVSDEGVLMDIDEPADYRKAVGTAT